MTHLWCILVPSGAYYTVSGILCSKNIENTENTEFPKRCDKLQKAQEYTRGESFWFILLNESLIEHFLGFIIDGIWFPIQSLITRLNRRV